jgi:hypothetical protein
VGVPHGRYFRRRGGAPLQPTAAIVPAIVITIARSAGHPKQSPRRAGKV